MIERRRRPFGRNFLLDTAAILLEKTVPFARIFSRNKATKHSSLVSQPAGGQSWTCSMKLIASGRKFWRAV
jgi:hypothetical protein